MKTSLTLQRFVSTVVEYPIETLVHRRGPLVRDLQRQSRQPDVDPSDPGRASVVNKVLQGDRAVSERRFDCGQVSRGTSGKDEDHPAIDESCGLGKFGINS